MTSWPGNEDITGHRQLIERSTNQINRHDLNKTERNRHETRQYNSLPDCAAALQQALRRHCENLQRFDDNGSQLTCLQSVGRTVSKTDMLEPTPAAKGAQC